MLKKPVFIPIHTFFETLIQKPKYALEVLRPKMQIVDTKFNGELNSILTRLNLNKDPDKNCENHAKIANYIQENTYAFAHETNNIPLLRLHSAWKMYIRNK